MQLWRVKQVIWHERQHVKQVTQKSLDTTRNMLNSVKWLYAPPATKLHQF
jgi:hypothetical protein